MYDPRQQQPPAIPPQFRQYGQQPQPYRQPQFEPRQLHVHPNVQNPYQYQQQPYPYQRPYPAAVAPKSTATGLLLGLFFPGVGCMYAGRPGIGVLILALWLTSIPLVFVAFIGVLTGLACWITSAILGYTMARDWNAAHGIVS